MRPHCGVCSSDIMNAQSSVRHARAESKAKEESKSRRRLPGRFFSHPPPLAPDFGHQSSAVQARTSIRNVRRYAQLRCSDAVLVTSRDALRLAHNACVRRCYSRPEVIAREEKPAYFCLSTSP
jgi:hypothetical protein